MRDDMILQVGWTLIHFLWQGLTVAVLLAVALRLLRERKPEIRYGVACLALLLLVLLPVATFNALMPARTVAPPTSVQELPASKLQPQPSASLPQGLSNPVTTFESNLPLIVTLWATGVGLLGLRMLGGLILVERLKRRLSTPAPPEWQTLLEALANRANVRRVIQLRESTQLKSPAAMGVLRATIILPAGLLLRLPPDQLEAVLLHEIAHIRRHDYLVNLLQSLAETILFYHPAVWYVSRIVRAERENCCDDFAVRVVGDPILYARALTNLEAERRLSPLPVLSATGGPFMNRITRILGVRSSNRNVSPLWAAVAALTITGVVIGGTLQANAQSAKAPTKKKVAKNKPAPRSARKPSLGAPIPAPPLSPNAALALPPRVKVSPADPFAQTAPSVPSTAGIGDPLSAKAIPPVPSSSPFAGQPLPPGRSSNPLSGQSIPSANSSALPPVADAFSGRTVATPEGIPTVPPAFSGRSVPDTREAVKSDPYASGVAKTRSTDPPAFSGRTVIAPDHVAAPEQPVKVVDTAATIARDGSVSVTAQSGNFAATIIKVAREAGRSAVVEPGAYRPLNLTLTDVPFDAAIQAICRSAGATWTNEGSVFYFTPLAQLAEVVPPSQNALPPMPVDTAVDAPPRLINISVKNRPLTEVIDMIRKADPRLQIVVKPGNYRKVTANLRAITAEEALDRVAAQAQGLVLKDGNLRFINYSRGR